jgi:hypothetical protein
MDYEKQDELRTKLSLIMRGILTFRNALQVMIEMKASGVPLLDDNEENRKKVLDAIERASHRARQIEYDALVAEYGPEAKDVLG